MQKFFCNFFKIFCFMFFINCFIFAENFNNFNKINDNIVMLEIKNGMSVNSIAKILKEKNLIKSPFYFKLLIKLYHSEKSLMAGVYEFSYKDSYREIIDKLRKGREKNILVNIPEGFDKFDIAERLSSYNLGKKDTFLKIIDERNLEGYLYPDTYFFIKSMSEETIINKMYEEFLYKTKNLFTNDMDRQKIMILASIIEKEAKIDEERDLISSVFYNRLKKNILLQSCATVQYAIKMKTGKIKSRLLYKDLEIESEYNTYKNLGLPKGPICSPGIKSIIASINPKETDFLFFLTNKKHDGSHIFSKTIAEHEKAKKINIVY